VKDIYKELNLETKFKEYEEQSYTKLMAMIDSVDEQLIPKEVFVKFIQKIYKRNK
jgi:farnesyl diphosphate synthase